MKLLPTLITLAIIFSFGFFIYWISTVVFPVVSVEATYQYKKTLSTVFGVSDLRGLIFPQFHIGIKEDGKHEHGGVVISSLYLDEPVIYNVDPNDADQYTQALKMGIAHASSTRLPGYGGLGYYFAHSSSPSLARQYNAVFYLLGKLKGGEEIILWHEEKSYHYIVSERRVTDPSDVSFLYADYPQETIVLQTCWPPGTSSKRLLVFATLKNK